MSPTRRIEKPKAIVQCFDSSSLDIVNQLSNSDIFTVFLTQNRIDMTNNWNTYTTNYDGLGVSKSIMHDAINLRDTNGPSDFYISEWTLVSNENDYIDAINYKIFLNFHL